MVKVMTGRASSPTLETVQMIEAFIRKNSPSGELTKTQVWKRLPRKVMYQTFCAAFEYLMASGKIAFAGNRLGVIWTWNPKLIQKALKREDLTWKLGK